MLEVDVVIPCYQCESFVETAIASALAQTLPPRRIICVNDGSQDGTLELLKRRAQEDTRILVIDQPNAGPAAARNKGVRAGSSPWLAFLDADDKWYPEKLAKQAALIEAHPQLRLVSTLYYGADGNQLKLMPVLKGKEPESLASQLLFHLISPSVAFFARSLFDQIGGLDESLPVGEDADFFYRALALSDYRLIREALAELVTRETGLSQNNRLACAQQQRDAVLRVLEMEVPSEKRPSAKEARRIRAVWSGRVARELIRAKQPRAAREELRAYRHDHAASLGLWFRAKRIAWRAHKA